MNVITAMWTKICANTNLADAQLALELEADAVGFIFAPSKRQVTTEQVAAITSQLPPSREKVGVFSTGDPQEILGCVLLAGLTAAQIHRDLDPALLRTLAARAAERNWPLKLIQTVAYEIDSPDRVAADQSFESALTAALAESSVWAVLIDAARSGASGGLGISFDWAHAAPILDRVRQHQQALGRAPGRIILAGGLRPENVTTAIKALHPWGVDVASGVEAEPGRKDPERLRRFLSAAKQTETRT